MSSAKKIETTKYPIKFKVEFIIDKDYIEEFKEDISEINSRTSASEEFKEIVEKL